MTNPTPEQLEALCRFAATEIHQARRYEAESTEYYSGIDGKTIPIADYRPDRNYDQLFALLDKCLICNWESYRASDDSMWHSIKIVGLTISQRGEGKGEDFRIAALTALCRAWGYTDA